MYVRYYGLLIGFAASLSVGLAGCGNSDDIRTIADPVTGRVYTPPKSDQPEDQSDVTIWTTLGLAKRESQRDPGPQTGETVSPVLWQAAHDTLNFAKLTSEDPITGLMVTDWYTPANKPNERFRVTVYILSRALRSDSMNVIVERQERAANGGWQDSGVSRDTVNGMETAILQRARQIHAERYRSTL